MLSQTKMQLWYPRTTSEENIKTYLNSARKKPNNRKWNVRKFSMESDISDIDFDCGQNCQSEEDRSVFSSRNQSPLLYSDYDENYGKYKKQSSSTCKGDKISDFIDPKYWKKENLCCGTIFRGVYGEIIIDPSLIKPCENRITQIKKEHLN